MKRIPLTSCDHDRIETKERQPYERPTIVYEGVFEVAAACVTGLEVKGAGACVAVPGLS